ncbi:DUF5675 family protein [Persicobacter diffluens]|uniref:DUF5675 domain-containing protein n=1 Tax=Persicobacter diffluens TaxID=981 RepID=A0AAN5AQJ5_9BACT|nr:hypothetical protein PEDI_54550 [Persicobacter diffluens]
MMIVVDLYRVISSWEGTLGLCVLPFGGYTFFTIEPPWRGNQRQISCIPPGEYQCKIRYSRRFGWCYHLTDVEGRSWILTHSGNVAGATDRGFKSHSLGCILFGEKRGRLWGQLAVLNSKKAMRNFMQLLDRNTFILRIHSPITSTLS